MSINFELVSFELGGVQPYGWGEFLSNFQGNVMGHEFTMVGVFKLVNTWNFSKGKKYQKLPALQWRERELWWEGDGLGGWDYKGETDKGDLYISAPTSPTWSGFAQGTTDPFAQTWVSKPAGGVKPELRPKLLTAMQRQMVANAEIDIKKVESSADYKKLAAEYLTARGTRITDVNNLMWFMIAEKLAANKRNIPCIALDRPGMAQSGGSGRSGGGFVSKTISPTRRRVLQFDLGIVGGKSRFTATQVLETLNGEPAISKFFYPGKPDDWCKNIPQDYLAYWRSRLNLSNINDQTFSLESQDTVNQWVQWAKRMDALTA